MEAILENPIGIIGGMGPLSSQLFYKMITEHTQAQRDQDHVNLIILSDVMVPDRTKAILSGDHDALITGWKKTQSSLKRADVRPFV